MWALDLGTTNSGLARWDRDAQQPRLVELPAICRVPGREEPLEAPRMVPSAVHVLERPSFWGKLGRWRPYRRSLVGQQALIGRAAWERNAFGVAEPGTRKRTARHSAYAPRFKDALATSPLQTLARLGDQPVSAREVARYYLRELLREAKRVTGERIRELTITAPVDAFESYRAELLAIGRSVGLRRVRFLDEPVAAAIGYGLGNQQHRRVLVIDFGGGTLDIAAVRLTAKGVEDGTCEVIAKGGRAVGGNLVDRWLLREFCERLDYPLMDEDADADTRFWYQVMLEEARRVKEAVHLEREVTFDLTPPEDLRRFEARLQGESPLLAITQDDVANILQARGLYDGLETCIDEVLESAAAAGVPSDAIDDVLLVGGSTLLPGVYHRVEGRFGRARVRAWQPFEAVAYGACVYAADQIHQTDFIVHDYGLVTFHPKTHDRELTVIVPRGTRFPTAPDLWKRQMVPTCSLGEPEKLFKLVISEIGQASGERRFRWDGEGRLHKEGGQEPHGAGLEPVVVPLNESNPTLGFLNPPHPPSDRSPRLELSFGVNADRWLCATVLDLKTGKHLMKDEAVVRLL